MERDYQQKLAAHLDNVLGGQAIRRILTVADDWMYSDVTNAALYISIAGFVDEANQLLECLWKSKWPHGRNTWLPDQSMEVLWHFSGKRPRWAPFPQRTIDEIEVAHREYMTFNRICRPMPTESYILLEGFQLWLRNIYLAAVSLETRQLPSADQEEEALRGFLKYFQRRDGYPQSDEYRDYDQSPCLAAELAAKLGRHDEAIALIRNWAKRYVEQNGMGYNFTAVSSNRHLARLLLQGVLAETLGLTRESCQTFLKGLLTAVETRIKRGRKLLYGRWSWERLIKSASRRAIEADGKFFTKEDRKAKWLGCQRGSSEAVAAAEHRLGIKLPLYYTAFIRFSNGLSALSPVTPALLAIEEIDYLRNVATADLFDAIKDYPGDDMAEVVDACILISDKNTLEQQVWLVPPRAANDPWQTWFFATWLPGEIRYPSFRHYFEGMMLNLKKDAGS